MPRTQSSRQRTLNPKQLDILYLLYKFRFITGELVAKQNHQANAQYTNVRLKILHLQNYIGRNYDSSYRIERRPASYYLLPRGLAVLRATPNAKASVIRSIYHDKIASDTFITHSLAIFGLYESFKQTYGVRLAFFTKSDLAGYSAYPKPLPDAYIRLDESKNGAKNRPEKQFMLEYYEESRPFFLLKRRISQLLEHAEDGDWDITKTDYPTVLIVCDTPALQKRLERHLIRTTQNTWTEVQFALAIKEAMVSMKAGSKIWRAITEDGETVMKKLEEL